MSSDQVAKLAATIEVLTNAVQFLVAERVAAQPPGVHGELLRVLQASFSRPARYDQALLAGAMVRQADLTRWTSIVAANLVDDARRQLGRAREGVEQADRAFSETASKMAEGTRRKGVLGVVGAAENGRSAA